MSTRVVLVFDKIEVAEEAKAALRRAGFDSLCFTDPAAALSALENADSVELLVTQAEFPAGMQNGASLALITKLSRPDVKILYIAKPEHRETVAGVVQRFLSPPATPVALVKEVRTMLSETSAAAE